MLSPLLLTQDQEKSILEVLQFQQQLLFTSAQLTDNQDL
jgi:hypothetical protein